MKREYGIDALKMLAMMGVVVHHILNAMPISNVNETRQWGGNVLF